MSLRLAKLIFIGGLLVWIANGAAWLWSDTTLGHDEAEYATETRELLAGHPKRYDYVSVGMTALAAPGILAGGSELALRIVPFLASLVFLLAAWRLARRTVGDESAYWLVGVLAGSHPIVKFNAQLLTDFPSTACLLAALCIVLDELTRDEGPRYRFVLVAPLFAASFYIRYGSALTIAIIGLAALALGWRAIVRRPAPVLVAVGVFLVLMLPHAIMAVSKTGSPFGILALSTSAGLPGGAGRWITDYFITTPIVRYGHLLAPVLAIGLVPLRRDRVSLLLFAIALGQVIAFGWMGGAQTRYVLVSIVVFAMFGIETIRGLVSRLAARARVAFAALAVAAVVAMWIFAFISGANTRERRLSVDRPTLLAAAAIRKDTGTTPCVVVTTWSTTQVEWYSRCELWLVYNPTIVRDRRVYVVSFDDAQFAGATIFNAPGFVHVVRLTP